MILLIVVVYLVRHMLEHSLLIYFPDIFDGALSHLVCIWSTCGSLLQLLKVDLIKEMTYDELGPNMDSFLLHPWPLVPIRLGIQGPNLYCTSTMGILMYFYVKWVQNNSLLLIWRKIVKVHGHKSCIIDDVKDLLWNLMRDYKKWLFLAKWSGLSPTWGKEFHIYTLSSFHFHNIRYRGKGNFCLG